MIEILLCPALSLLLLGAMLGVVHHLDRVEDVERKELQKSLSECLD